MINDFIETYKLSDDIVDNILTWFKKHEKHAVNGSVASEVGEVDVNKNVKDSMDLDISPTYMEEPFKSYYDNLNEYLKLYANKYSYLKDAMNTFGLSESMNIQKYPVGGGFKSIHCERTGHFNNSIKRCLVFMTYLNDVDDGGTEFIYQNKIVKAEKGKTLIWPSDWTHIHKGQISNTKEKIIITGWLSHLWDV